MARLTLLGIANVALAAGWRGQDWVVAIAVAAAESGGDTNSHATRGEDSRGLWQINVRAHPDAAGLNLYDPAVNARYAYGLWQKRGWQPWSAHNNGSYLLFMPGAAAAAALVPASMIAAHPSIVPAAIADQAKNLPGAGGIADMARNAIALATKAGAWLGNRQNWARVASVIMGGALLVGGLVLIARVAAGNVVGEVAGSVVKPVVGNIVKGAKE